MFVYNNDNINNIEYLFMLKVVTVVAAKLNSHDCIEVYCFDFVFYNSFTLYLIAYFFICYLYVLLGLGILLIWVAKYILNFSYRDNKSSFVHIDYSMF